MMVGGSWGLSSTYYVSEFKGLLLGLHISSSPTTGRGWVLQQGDQGTEKLSSRPRSHSVCAELIWTSHTGSRGHTASLSPVAPGDQGLSKEMTA